MADSKDSQDTPAIRTANGKQRSAETQDRLAEALRANLHRRKSQERARNSAPAAKKPQNP